MARVLIIGAGGVGNVVIKKCAQNSEVFSDILIASRRIASCDKIASEIKSSARITTAQVDADDVPQTVALIRKFRPDLVLNVALPYQDLTIMDACLEAGVHYLDTANYEPRDVAKFEYSWQWAYQEKFQKAGLMALLGCGFDPGVTNVFTAWMHKHRFDKVDTLDIIDCNAGSHGQHFATNFNPEINIREITQNGRFWQNGQWIETKPLEIHQAIDYPQVGPKESYLLFHEELESLVKHFPDIQRARFWMTFGQQYITHLTVLQNVGMTRIDPIDFKGQQIIPLEFLKALLPEPGSLGANYTGKTCIGVQLKGQKDGKPTTHFVYNVCDHAACWQEVQAQAVSYTTGVPAMIGAALMLTGQWKGAGVFNMEQLNPDPFMAMLNQWGLPWQELAGVELVP